MRGGLFDIRSSKRRRAESGGARESMSVNDFWGFSYTRDYSLRLGGERFVALSNVVYGWRVGTECLNVISSSAGVHSTQRVPTSWPLKSQSRAQKVIIYLVTVTRKLEVSSRYPCDKKWVMGVCNKAWGCEVGVKNHQVRISYSGFVVIWCSVKKPSQKKTARKTVCNFLEADCSR